jgi:5-methylcytosine-specific restriction enzyme subunit McrC
MDIFFEYEKKEYKDSFLKSEIERESFKSVLNKLWAERKQLGFSSVYFEDENQTEQQFFTFYDTGIKAGKYIGTIKYGDEIIQIIPKTLKNSKYTENQLLEISNKNLLWWLSRCSRIDFPKSFSGWNSRSFSFLDVLIYVFAALTREDLIYNKHQSYIEKEEAIGTLRGRIDFSKYAINYSTGNAHVLPCIYDSLEIDNLYNRIVKFTSKLLLQNTDNDEIKKILKEIIWILDDVDDVFITSADCGQVIVSPLNDNMKTILDYCRMFLSGMSIKTFDNDLEIFSFLIPTEKLFEDFIFGFIKNKFQFSNGILNIQSQGNKQVKQFLATEKDEFGKEISKVFKLKPDIYISKQTEDIIIDTKYKSIILKEDISENEQIKNGVAISDIYQMLAYTVKLNVKTCHLLYPNTIGLNKTFGTHYEIEHKNGEVSKVYYHRIPTLIENELGELLEVIEKKEEELYRELNKIINL